MNITPIGTFISELKEKYHAARQPGISSRINGVIHLYPGLNFEQAVDDLEGFERIWVIFVFNLNRSWKPKVLPPRGDKKRGVFATRSPHRPNPIGMSCVELIKVEGLKLFIGSHDLLDQTPILDIKPYLPYADAFPDAKAGWVDQLKQDRYYHVCWSSKAEKQRLYIAERGGPDLASVIENRLQNSPFPHPSHRIKELKSGGYELAYKSWRIRYSIEQDHVCIEDIYSGYRNFSDEDRYGDFALHQNYQRTNSVPPNF